MAERNVREREHGVRKTTGEREENIMEKEEETEKED